MRTEEDVTRTVRSWLQAERHESADRVLNDVLALVNTNTQRPPRGLMRGITSLGTAGGLAMTAAAVLVVVAGVSLAPSLGVFGGPPSSTPPASPLSSEATPWPGIEPWPEIEPGPHHVVTPQVTLTLTMPAGWSGDDTGIGRLPRVGWTGMLGLAPTQFDVTQVVTDVCTDEVDVEFVAVGPTVEDLTRALENQVGVERSGPFDVTLGGYPARKFVMNLALACPGPEGHGIWADATGTYDFWLRHRETGIVYIVDVDGTRLVITSQYGVNASTGDIAQLEAITASIDIEPLPDPAPRTDVGSGGWLATGRHALTADGVPLSFSVPTLVQHRGWARYGTFSVTKDTVGPQGAEAVVYWTRPEGAETDPCSRLLSPTAGTSAADVVAAVATAPGTELVSGPSETTLDGHAATFVELRIQEDLGCDPGYFFTWKPAPGGPGWWTTNVGDTIRAWVVDVDGAPFVIVGETTNDASPRLEQEVRDIVESIQFE